MADIQICDVCEREVKRVPVERTCHLCAGLDRQFKLYVDGRLEDLMQELMQTKHEWMRSNGARHIPPPVEDEDAVSPPHSDAIPPSKSSTGEPS
jgi:hypothetical protein